MYDRGGRAVAAVASCGMWADRFKVARARVHTVHSMQAGQHAGQALDEVCSILDGYWEIVPHSFPVVSTLTDIDQHQASSIL